MELGGQRVTVPSREGLAAGPAWLVLRPEAVRLASEEPADRSGLGGTVRDVAFRGTGYTYRVDIAGATEPLKAEMPGAEGAPFRSAAASRSAGALRLAVSSPAKRTGHEPVLRSCTGGPPSGKLRRPTRYELWYGRDEPPAELVEARAGALAALLDGIAIRTIHFGGVEPLRGVYVAVRDEAWATVPIQISDLHRHIDRDRFRISFAARNRRGPIDVVWRGEIDGQADGTIRYSVRGGRRASFATAGSASMSSTQPNVPAARTKA